MEKIRIGYIPTRRNVFNKEEAIRQKEIIREEIGKYPMAELIDIEDINEEGLLFDDGNRQQIIDKMIKNNVDGLFFPHCNFGTEDLTAKIAKAVDRPVLLWGPRDDAPLPDGLRTRDTQCGLFATGKVLRRFKVPFTYIENCRVTDEAFIKGYDLFVRVCAVMKSIRNMKILQIGPRPDSFWSVICNEGELVEKFNIEVFPVSLTELVESVNRIREEEGEEYSAVLKMIQEDIRIDSNNQEDTKKAAALKVAIHQMCREHKCSCAALQCWNALQTGLGIMPCMVNAILMGEGIPVACEMDIHGAITAVILQSAALNETPVFFADLTVRHPENDNAELLWHCGNFPPSLAKDDAVKKAGRHFIFPEHLFGTGEWEIKGGSMTICRFDGDQGEYRLFAGEGRGTEGPGTKGTYVWMETDDWPAWERTLVEGPYIHHVAGIHGQYSEVLEEAAKYMDIGIDKM